MLCAEQRWQPNAVSPERGAAASGLPPTAAQAPEAGHNDRMDSHEPDFDVVGEKVALGPLRRDLAADYARWMNEPDVRHGLNQMGIATP